MTATVSFRRGLLAIVGGLLLAQTPQTAQDLAQLYAPLALAMDVSTGRAAPLRKCGTTFDLLSKAITGIQAMTPLDDGRPLRADQFPRFLRPTHTGVFGFNNFLVLGDYETVTFERFDEDGEDRHTDEIWQRSGTQNVAGRVVSVFNPRWTIDVLHATLRRQTWGVDSPTVFWGRVVVPGSAPVVTAVPTDHVGDEERITVSLNMAPPNVPTSQLTKINDEVQFMSHVVNIVDADFGDSRVTGGDTDLNEAEITQKFYEHFQDAYEIVAILSQATQIADYGAFHGAVRNDITGIGLPVFDSSATYGSAGVIQGVEGYPPGGWAEWSTFLHEAGHQYGEYSGVWDRVGPPAPITVIDRKGHQPDFHTPMAFPHEFLYSATTEAQREIVQVGGAFQIARTMPLILYNPLTLYRMGLIAAEELPTYKVFVDQGQFDEETSIAPEIGTAVTGDTVDVTINDIMAADGTRRGPAVTKVRRALVYVSRAGLVPKAEMDIINFFAKRFGESSGVTSYDRYPSYAEATGGRATMVTDINPKPDEATTVAGVLQGATKIEPGPQARCVKAGTRAIVGFTLDNEVGGCLTAGTSVTVSGTLNLTDQPYNQVCVRFQRYGDANDDNVFECPVLNGNWFSAIATFPANKPGGYSMELFAFWPESGGQFPTTKYTGAFELLPAQ